MKVVYLLILTVLLSGEVFSQSYVKAKADQYFQSMEYYNAIPHLEDLANRADRLMRKGKAADLSIIRKAGLANFFIRDYERSVYWFDILIKGNSAVVEDYVFTFDALCYLGKYDEALQVLKELGGVDSTQFKYLAYSNYTTFYQSLRKDSARYKIEYQPFNSGFGDFGPSFYEDGLVYVTNRRPSTLGNKYGWDNTHHLELYYTLNGKGGFTKKSAPFNSKFRISLHDGPVAFSPSGKSAAVTHNNSAETTTPGNTVSHLSLHFLYKGTDNNWGESQPFQYNSPEYNVGHATFSQDGKTLYFSSDMPGGIGGVDIWQCTRQASGWSKPVNLGKSVNTPYDEMFPFISTDNVLYFASKGHVGLGGFDLFFTRLNSEGGWISPLNLGYPLNTQHDDFSLVVDSTGRFGFFSSDRKNHVDNIYSVKMERLIRQVELEVYDSLQPVHKVSSVQVLVINPIDNDSSVYTTDSIGKLILPVATDRQYALHVKHSAYQPKSLSLHFPPADGDSAYSITRVPLLRIAPSPLNTIQFSLVDLNTGLPIRNMPVSLRKMNTDEKVILPTDNMGKLVLPASFADLPKTDSIELAVDAFEMDSSGVSYFPVKVPIPVSSYLNPVGNQLPSIKLRSLQVGDQFTLEDIYYDYKKWDLRPLSIVRLDKACAYLKKNPKVHLELSSHTDSRASYAYNIDLSEKRAKSCVDYMVNVRGITKARLISKGYGETRLVNQCADGVFCSESDHQLNRRTEIRVIKID